jgi:hypothetical protein
MAQPHLPRRGLWGVLSARGVRLFGVGYHLETRP